MTGEKRKSRSYRTEVIASMAGMAFVILACLFPSLALLFWIVALISLLSRKSQIALYFLVFSPLALFPAIFLKATSNYFMGQASIEHFGLPGPQFFNLNRETRTYNSTSGCVAYGFEPLTQGTNNLAVQFWTNLLGYQPGVYTGPYPDRLETTQIITSSAQDAEVSQTGETIRFSLGGIPVEITKWRTWAHTTELDSCKAAKVAIVNDELIIIKPNLTVEYQVAYLAEKRTGKIFAIYAYPEDLSHVD